MESPLRRLLAAGDRRERHHLYQAGIAAVFGAFAVVLLLGLSGWFIAAAAIAGGAGAAAASAFNPLLPSACIRLLAMTRTASRYAERLRGHDAALRSLARVRPAVFRALADAPVARAMSLSVGDMASRVVQDVDQVEAAIVRQSAGWGAWGATLTGLALLSLAGAPIAFAGATLLGALWLLARHVARRAACYGRAVPAAQGRLKQDFTELIAAAPELRAYGLEDWACACIAQAGDRLALAQRPCARETARLELLLGAAPGVASIVVLAMADGSSLPMAALAALGATMMVDGIATHLRGGPAKGQLAAAEARIEDILPTTDAPAAQAARSTLTPPTIALPHLGTRLAPGSIVGLRGPSGCGKTSLLEALVGLREARGLRIAIDGRKIACLDVSRLRACSALAPQDAALMAGTVRDNLRLGDADASEQAMWQALADAALDQRIQLFPTGLDTWLGEDGERLSAGERRRLSLARAYLRRAPWLLLDEPTEGLDLRTEARVIERLQARLRRTGQGALVVSHRPRPLRICEKVIEMRHAGIAAEPSRVG